MITILYYTVYVYWYCIRQVPAYQLNNFNTQCIHWRQEVQLQKQKRLNRNVISNLGTSLEKGGARRALSEVRRVTKGSPGLLSTAWWQLYHLRFIQSKTIQTWMRSFEYQMRLFVENPLKGKIVFVRASSKQSCHV